MKAAWDAGVTADDALLLTASSAHDLKRGAERLPGRRGKGKDYLQLPLSFRDYCVAAHGIRFDDEPLAAEEFLTARGERVAARLPVEVKGDNSAGLSRARAADAPDHLCVTSSSVFHPEGVPFAAEYGERAHVDCGRRSDRAQHSGDRV